jgi:hypothetical protein
MLVALPLGEPVGIRRQATRAITVVAQREGEIVGEPAGTRIWRHLDGMIRRMRAAE